MVRYSYMGKREQTTIDALFGSKTRVKLLYLFLNNPGKSFYVREITRLIDEQINSVRRELSNMLAVGIITSDSADNKLYYEISQRYEHYDAFRAIFAGQDEAKPDKKAAKSKTSSDTDKAKWRTLLASKGLRIVVAAGILVEGSASSVDLLLVGSISPQKIRTLVAAIEKQEARPINYSHMQYEEFYYRLSVRDRFISEIISGRHEVLLDVDNVITSQN